MADRGDFAALLRAWRERLQPAAVGFPAGNRRTSGLRREEVALLAGVSVDYLVRLEQGRADRPSAQVVASLARVLQLSDLERDQLHLAAGLPAPLPSAVPTHIPASVQRLLARLPDVAIGVWTAHWTPLTRPGGRCSVTCTPGSTCSSPSSPAWRRRSCGARATTNATSARSSPICGPR